MCFKCLRHTYSLIAGEHISMECNPCPAGAFCPGGADIYPLEGYWPTMNLSAELSMAECSNAQACLGAIDFGQVSDPNLHSFVGSVLDDSNVLEIVDYDSFKGRQRRGLAVEGDQTASADVLQERQTIDPRGYIKGGTRLSLGTGIVTVPLDIFVDCSDLNLTTCAFYDSRCYWSASLYDGWQSLDEYGYDLTGSCIPSIEVEWVSEYAKSDDCHFAAHTDSGIVVDCYYDYARDACDNLLGFSHDAVGDTCVFNATAYAATSAATLEAMYPDYFVSLNLTKFQVPLTEAFDVMDLSDIIILPDGLETADLFAESGEPQTCGEGYWGVQCRRCEAGWARATENGPCEQCFRSELERVIAAWSLVGYILVYMFIIIVLVASALASAKDDRDSTSILLKILVSWLQVRLRDSTRVLFCFIDSRYSSLLRRCLASLCLSAWTFHRRS